MNGGELVGLASVLVTGFLLVRAGNATVGEATAAALYFHRAFDPVGMLFVLVDDFQEAASALTRLAGVMTLDAGAAAATRPATRAAIRLAAIHHAYVDGHPVLHGIDLRHRARRAGRADRHHGRGQDDDRADRGRAGRRAARAAERAAAVEVGGDVGLVTQEVHVFAGTLAADLRLAKPDATDEELRAALDGGPARAGAARAARDPRRRRRPPAHGGAGAAGRARPPRAARPAGRDPRRGRAPKPAARARACSRPRRARARRPHRAGDRAPAHAGAHRGPDRRARTRPDRRAGHARRNCSRAGADTRNSGRPGALRFPAMVRGIVIGLVAALALTAPAHARERAPGAPGGKADWASADKQGFGTAASRESRVWFTLRDADMTEVHYPDLSHPSARHLAFMVDGKRVTTGTVTQRHARPTRRPPRASDWRLIRTYTTDPERSVVLIRVRFEALDGEDHDLELEYDPQLYNDGSDDVGWTRGHALLSPRQPDRLRAARPALADPHELGLQGPDREPARAHLRRAAPRQRRPAGPHAPQRPRAQGHDAGARLRHARLGGARRRDRLARRRLRGRRQRLQGGLDRVPQPAQADPGRGAAGRRRLRDLAAGPEGPRGQGQPGRVRRLAEHALGLGRATIDADNPRSGPYHLVWPRDLYQVATALHAAGDTDGANAALDFAFDKQQLEDGSFPQNTQVDGRPKWTATQMDQVGLPIVLAWQLNRAGRGTGATSAPPPTSSSTTARRASRSAGRTRRATRPRRSPPRSPAWSAPPTSRAATATARRAATYERKADSWQRNVERWTATTNGPYAPKPYYLRITKDRKPDKGTTYAIGDSGPSKMDQRRVVDVSFLELVRLGVKRPDDRAIVNTLRVVDQQLGAGAVLAPLLVRRLRRAPRREVVAPVR